MNVYDFDKTIHKTDSTRDFYKWCMRRHPCLIKYVPSQISAYIGYKRGRLTKTKLKQTVMAFVKDIEDIDKEIELYWDKNIKKSYGWYQGVQKQDDLVISASPEFLVIPACKRLNIKNVIASKIDKKTGTFTGENCYGEEKVNRYRVEYGNESIEKFYSDSYSDTPLAKIAKSSYIVDNGKLKEWDNKSL